MARRLIVQLRRELQGFRSDDLAVPLEFMSLPIGHIPGVKISFGDIIGLLSETRVFARVIEIDIVEVVRGKLQIRFSIRGEGRSEAVPASVGAFDDAIPLAADRLLHLVAPFHVAYRLLDNGSWREAGEIALAAGNARNVPARMRAACWCLLALLRIEYASDAEGAAQGLYSAKEIDPSYPLTAALIRHLLSADLGKCKTVAERDSLATTRNWYRELGTASRASLSDLSFRFMGASARLTIRFGREAALRRAEERFEELQKQFTNAIEDKTLSPQIRLWDILHAYQVMQKIVDQQLSEYFRPRENDSLTFLNLYGRLLERANAALALVRAREHAIDALAEAAAQEQAAFEEKMAAMRARHPDFDAEPSELERLLKDLGDVAGAQAAKAKKVRQVVDGVNELLRQQAAEITRASAEASQRQSRWNRLTSTAFPSLAPSTTAASPPQPMSSAARDAALQAGRSASGSSSPNTGT